MNVKIIKSRRRTIVIKIEKSGEVLVKAPIFLSDAEIYEFVNKKAGWINKKTTQILEEKRQNDAILLKKEAFFKGERVIYTENYLNLLYKSSIYLIERTFYLAQKHGFCLNGVKVKKYKSRWGACTKNKEITLNVFLMALDDELIDSVIIHELCHTKHFNHQREFHNLYKSIISNANQIKTRLIKFAFITKIDY